jgi:hypothetical protein
MGKVCSTNVGEKKCMQYIGGRNIKERDHLKDLGVNVRILIKWIFKRENERAWSLFVWLRVGATGGFL